MLANNIEAGDPNYKGLFAIKLINDGNLQNLKDVIEIYTELWLGIRVISDEDQEKIDSLSQSQMRVQYVSQLLDELLDSIGLPPDEDYDDDDDDDEDEEFLEGAD
jgi:hypothetical protein